MPPVGGCVGRGRRWFGGSGYSGLRVVVGPCHRAGQHVDDAAADVDVQGEERVGSEVTERLERCVQGSCRFLVERKVDWLVEGLLFRFHSSPDECPATRCWAIVCLGMS